MPFCCQASDDVLLVGLAAGDELVAGAQRRRLEGVDVGGLVADDLNIEPFEGLCRLGIVLDDEDVVVGRELSRESQPDVSAARDNDAHRTPSGSAPARLT